MEKNLKNIQTFEQHTDKNSNISDARSSDDTITITKNELETFIQDWEQGYGSWSDTSIRVVRFLGMDETDGL